MAMSRNPVRHLLLLCLGLVVVVGCIAYFDTGKAKTKRCPSIAFVTEEMFAKDVNRFSDSELTIHYQNKASGSGDRSGAPLFSHVDRSKLSKGTFRLFRALLDNYNPEKGQREEETPQELEEEDAFLSAILDTPVMEVLLNYSRCKGWAKSKTALRKRLQIAWFDEYSRSGDSGVLDSSGFEHVMVGDFAGKKIGGLHNWVSFYELEQQGEVNYNGYIRKSEPNLLSCSFEWDGHFKPIGGFAIGTSPEFDLAIYSLSFWNKPNGGATPISLGGSKILVQTIAKNGHVATAYVKT